MNGKMAGALSPDLSKGGNGDGGSFFITVTWLITAHGLSRSTRNKFFAAIRTTIKFRRLSIISVIIFDVIIVVEQRQA